MFLQLTNSNNREQRESSLIIRIHDHSLPFDGPSNDRGAEVRARPYPLLWRLLDDAADVVDAAAAPAFFSVLVLVFASSADFSSSGDHSHAAAYSAQ